MYYVNINTFGLLCQMTDELFEMQKKRGNETLFCFTDIKSYGMECDESCLFRIK